MAGILNQVNKGTLSKANDGDRDPADPAGKTLAVPPPARSANLHAVKTTTTGEMVYALDADRIGANPRNPRRTYKDLPGLAAAIKARGQLQSIKIAETEAYLRIFPEDTERVRGLDYVVAVGSRRLKAVQLSADLTEIHAVIDNELAATRLSWKMAGISENEDREQLSIMDLAFAYADAAREYGRGGQTAVAEQFGISEAQVSSRIALTKLIPELQNLIDDPEQKRLFPIGAARKVAGMPEEDQHRAAAMILELPEDDQFKAWKAYVKSPKPAQPADTDPGDASAKDSENADEEANLHPVKSAASDAPGTASLSLAGMTAEDVATALIAQFSPPELETIATLVLNRDESNRG